MNPDCEKKFSVLQDGGLYQFVGMFMELLKEGFQTKQKPAKEKLDAFYARFPDLAEENQDFSSFTAYTAPQEDMFVAWVDVLFVLKMETAGNNPFCET